MEIGRCTQNGVCTKKNIFYIFLSVKLFKKNVNFRMILPKYLNINFIVTIILASMCNMAVCLTITITVITKSSKITNKLAQARKNNDTVKNCFRV